ncbi:MAG: alpha/beta hydrolase [Bacteroidota bacterium]
MKKIQTILMVGVVLLSTVLSGWSQRPAICDGQTLVRPIFQEIHKNTVQFGQNTNSLGHVQNLMLDVYTPVEAVKSSRPLMIWLFGRGFISGSRADMEQQCRYFAQRGYVAASIDYRLWDLRQSGVPDSLDLLDTAVKAMGDLKAAIRFFRQDAAEDNQYQIDPNRIVIGGYSAGAVVALHTAYLDAQDQIPNTLQQLIDQNGGFEGNSGDVDHLRYSSKVNGVINCSGALFQKDWLDADGPSLMSYHGTVDQVVPFEEDYVRLFDQPFMKVMGSGSLHQKADVLGLANYLMPVSGGHEDIHKDASFQEQRQSFYQNCILMIHDDYCQGMAVGEKDISYLEPKLRLFPNPAANQLTIAWSAASPVTYLYVCDQAGRVVHTLYQPIGETFILDREITGEGVFSVHLRYEDALRDPERCQFMFH